MISTQLSIKRLEHLNRDVVLPAIPDDKLPMALYTCGSKHCLGGWAATGFFKGLRLVAEGHPATGRLEGQCALERFFGINVDPYLYMTSGVDEFEHIFGWNLPDDKSILAANITDLIEYRKSL